jgi:acyl-CoA synthetase (AMP-forming)/AMP-acid ligase II
VTSGFNFTRIWERVAAVDPDHLAVAGDARRVTYGELDERAERLAGYLASMGIERGDAIGLLLHNRVEYLEAFFAASKLGAIPFNINYRYRAKEIAYLLDNARAQVLFYERSLQDEVDDAVALAGVVPLLIDCGDGDPDDTVGFEVAVASGVPVAGRSEQRGDDLLYLYTGGTTGMPKAVMWRHQDLYDALWELTRRGQAVPDPVEAVERGKRALTALPASPLMHGTALFIAIQTLAAGGTVVICDGAGFDAGRAITRIRSDNVGLLSIVGDAFARPLLDALELDGGRLGSLQVVVSSGVQWSPGVKSELLERLPALRLIDSLGASEGPASQSISTKDTVIEPARFTAGGRVRVIDDDGLDVIPGSGQVGLLATVGPGPIGYLGDPAKSAATFREVGGERMTVPGDHATVELDGTITFLGRGSACINSGGEKVFPEEVEAVLRSHPNVYDCAVVGVPDPKWGERVVALVQPSDDATAAFDAELDAACLEALAAYKRPKNYLQVETLGRSAAGKVDLQALRTLAIDRVGAIA